MEYNINLSMGRFLMSQKNRTAQKSSSYFAVVLKFSSRTLISYLLFLPESLVSLLYSNKR